MYVPSKGCNMTNMYMSQNFSIIWWNEQRLLQWLDFTVHKKKVAQKFTLVYVIHYGMLTVHMPFLRNMAALLKICFKNLEGIITSENIMKINLLAYGWFMLDENSNHILRINRSTKTFQQWNNLIWIIRLLVNIASTMYFMYV